MNTKSCLSAVAVATTLLFFPALLVAQQLALPAAADIPVHLAGPQVDPAQAFGKLISGQAEEFIGAAEAMPADKYDFAPTNGDFKGVRTFAQQVTHVAQAQYFFFASFGIKPTIDPKSLSKLTTKDDIIKALKASFAFAEQAVGTITPQNAFAEIHEVDGANTRVTIAAFSLAHTNDHYGQMVEYLRMNGIIPPASRK